VGAGTGAGVGTGTGAGVGTGTGAGVRTGTGAGVRTGTGAGVRTGTGAGVAAITGAKLVSEPEPPPQPIAKLTETAAPILISFADIENLLTLYCRDESNGLRKPF
jgi:hypothetical protein